LPPLVKGVWGNTQEWRKVTGGKTAAPPGIECEESLFTGEKTPLGLILRDEAAPPPRCAGWLSRPVRLRF